MSFIRFHKTTSSALCKSFAQTLQQAGKQQKLNGQLSSAQASTDLSNQETITMQAHTQHTQALSAEATLIALSAELWPAQTTPVQVAQTDTQAAIEMPELTAPNGECLAHPNVANGIGLELMPQLDIDVQGPPGSGGLT